MDTSKTNWKENAGIPCNPTDEHQSEVQNSTKAPSVFMTVNIDYYCFYFDLFFCEELLMVKIIKMINSLGLKFLVEV